MADRITKPNELFSDKRATNTTITLIYFFELPRHYHSLPRLCYTSLRNRKAIDMTLFHRWRFYAQLIYVHAIVRYRHLSRTSGLPVTLGRVLAGVGDDVMLLLLRG